MRTRRERCVKKSCVFYHQSERSDSSGGEFRKSDAIAGMDTGPLSDEHKGEKDMKTQLYLIREWMLVSQWLSQVSLPAFTRRSIVFLGLAALAFGICLLSLSVLPVPFATAMHTLSQSVLHLIGRIPFGEPFPP